MWRTTGASCATCPEAPRLRDDRGRERKDAIRAAALAPDLILMHIQLPELDGLRGDARAVSSSKSNGEGSAQTSPRTSAAIAEGIDLDHSVDVTSSSLLVSTFSRVESLTANVFGGVTCIHSSSSAHDRFWLKFTLRRNWLRQSASVMSGFKFGSQSLPN